MHGRLRLGWAGGRAGTGAMHGRRQLGLAVGDREVVQASLPPLPGPLLWPCLPP